ncbi:hypothetical protein EVAR_27391_1 [Eumeta japonica]|uniref:Uncharacterized protein n=1 Tax=Eumeta variegata TaxID=151549 RepID=A0A4C1X107_EUMVA|nr:hypothetical protein EVAR_27391_1 [Eumeta japonica]
MCDFLVRASRLSPSNSGFHQESFSLRVSRWDSRVAHLSDALGVGLHNSIDLVARVHKFHYLESQSPFRQSSIHSCPELGPLSFWNVVDPCTRPRPGPSPHLHGKRDRVMVQGC